MEDLKPGWNLGSHWEKLCSSSPTPITQLLGRAVAFVGAGIAGVILAELREVSRLDRVQNHPRSRGMRTGSGFIPNLLGDIRPFLPVTGLQASFCPISRPYPRASPYL